MLARVAQTELAGKCSKQTRGRLSKSDCIRRLQKLALWNLFVKLSIASVNEKPKHTKNLPLMSTNYCHVNEAVIRRQIHMQESVKKLLDLEN